MRDVGESRRGRLVVSAQDLQALTADEFMTLVEEASPEGLERLLTLSSSADGKRKGDALQSAYQPLEKFLGPARFLFDSPKGKRSLFNIIAWWESRRLVFNLVVGLAGMFTLTQMVGFAARSTLAEGAVVYGVAANICYCFGWMAEIIARALFKERAEHLGGILLALGFMFSVALTLAPAAILFLAHTVRLF